ncbi:MAG TPA: hypothetical protein VN924_03430 [Bryobacteraceae bacterium]|nr:hypothetical protein [Bryobacteraceae bacterium]
MVPSPEDPPPTVTPWSIPLPPITTPARSSDPSPLPPVKLCYNFTGSGGDGAQPYADLLYSSGWLYGTTYSGGTSSDGTVFAWEL